MTRTQFAACVCTKFCHFSMINRPKMAVFWSKIEFFGSPYFEGVGCEQADCRGTQTTKKQFAARVGTKFWHFSWKKWLFFWSKTETDKQLKTPPLF